jgi:hypothetical protein
VENSGKNNFWLKTRAKIIFGKYLGKNYFWCKTLAKIFFGGKLGQK